MDPENNYRSMPAIICVFIASFLILYAVIDFTITQPKIRNSVREVAVQFDSMKIYLDNKLPQIDSALVIHREQIREQTKHLEEINTISSILIQN